MLDGKTFQKKLCKGLFLYINKLFFMNHSALTKSRYVISNILSYVLYFCLLLLWVMGIIHSYKDHSKIDFAASFIPPWGWYRGVESFWHKDKSTSDLDLPNDMKMACELLGDNNDTQDQSDINNKIEKFAIKIKKYPPYELLTIKNAASSYIRYNWYAASDLIEAYKRVSNGETVIFQESNNTKLVYDSLHDYYKFVDIEIVKSVMDSSTQHLSPEYFDTEKLKDGIQQMKELQRNKFESLKDAYYKIFGEQFSL